ncbi:NADH:flavin oxidoreductase/NADH oxidase family protein [uncultured Alteromonas sp.]|jgi:2,4-dienoyl-CoA reductase-like NADH-dependent reductase (Old Yellow Enzyme family)|uniref:NADH:flavin oxidoreductase/NADH oxidase family protein n=1 Tax=uncultured Alteromonas sp. TaxID=179113 RepID=UPI0025D3CD0C|nr:NADH:flavin oxidoreductase/NADH oxidase family protein [uncultured Alteromonas sp.]
MSLFHSLTLPNGIVIPNRIAKAAMEENLATADNLPSPQMMALYAAWASGGSGLLISGNVMIDGRAMTGPGGVVLENDEHLPVFQQWAALGKQQGATFFLQLNHPGRQMPASLGQPTWAPSEVPMALGKMSTFFNPPQAMTNEKIADIISRFVTSARLAEQAGFDGVEIHAAHGYLINQFLSPLTNKRTDQWGGNLAGRARLLLEVIKQTKAAVSPSFAIAVKLNSADFQRGGFSYDDARQVVLWLNELNIDLLELSGGSYEAPAMQGSARDGSTLAREAFFLTFAAELKQIATMPVMVTGGIRRLAVAREVRAQQVDIVGMATALAICPELPNLWQQGKDPAPQLRPVTWKNKPLASLANMAMVKYQLRRVSKRQKAQPGVAPFWAFLTQQIEDFCRTRRYQRKMAKH